MLLRRRSAGACVAAALLVSGCGSPPQWTSRPAACVAPPSATCVTQTASASAVERLVSAAEELAKSGKHDTALRVSKAALDCDPTPQQVARLNDVVAKCEHGGAPRQPTLASAEQVIPKRADAKPAAKPADATAEENPPWLDELLGGPANPAPATAERALANPEAAADLATQFDEAAVPRVTPAQFGPAAAPAAPQAPTAAQAPAVRTATAPPFMDAEEWQSQPEPAVRHAASAEVSLPRTGTWVSLESSAASPVPKPGMKVHGDSEWQPVSK